MRHVAVGLAMATILAWHTAPALAQNPPPDGDHLRFGDVRAADANSDGKVTFEELKAKVPNLTQDQYKKLDKNGDGVLTMEDRPERGPGERGPGGGGPGGGGGRLMERADTNKDGKLSLEELTAAGSRIDKDRFTKLDKNGDGFLTPDELEAIRTQGFGGGEGGPGDMFAKADADHNGEVTYDELTKVFPNITKEIFTRIDKNGDGVISKEEAAQMRQQGGRGEFMQRLQQADTDHDGKITFEEMSKAMPGITKERFDQMDTNKDGVLTQEDRPQGRRGREPGEGQADAIKKLLEADKNGDGKVSYDEAVIAKPGYPKEAFDRFDTNKDGFVSKEDIPSGQ